MRKVRTFRRALLKKRASEREKQRGKGLNMYAPYRLPKFIPAWHKAATHGIRSIHWWSSNRHLLNS